MSDTSDRLTIRRAADLIGVAPGALRSAIFRGRLRGERMETPRGPVWYIARADLDDWRAKYPGSARRRAPAVITI
jgi:hypothetical protein